MVVILIHEVQTMRKMPQVMTKKKLISAAYHKNGTLLPVHWQG